MDMEGGIIVSFTVSTFFAGDRHGNMGRTSNSVAIRGGFQVNGDLNLSIYENDS